MRSAHAARWVPRRLFLWNCAGSSVTGAGADATVQDLQPLLCGRPDHFQRWRPDQAVGSALHSSHYLFDSGAFDPLRAGHGPLVAGPRPSHFVRKFFDQFFSRRPTSTFICLRFCLCSFFSLETSTSIFSSPSVALSPRPLSAVAARIWCPIFRISRCSSQNQEPKQSERTRRLMRHRRQMKKTRTNDARCDY